MVHEVRRTDWIGRITPPARRRFTVTGISLYDIVAGPDGNLWYTNRTNDSIGRITPTGP